MGELRPIPGLRGYERFMQVARLLWRHAADAPTADPRECRGCIHPRLSHSTWGCEWCSCGVSIVDLTGLGVLHV